MTFKSVCEEDFEELVAIRIAALREGLERVGRFDPERAKARLQDSFSPEHTRFIVSGTERTGFYALRPTPEGWQLDHLTCFRRSKVGDRSGGDEGDFS